MKRKERPKANPKNDPLARIFVWVIILLAVFVVVTVFYSLVFSKTRPLPFFAQVTPVPTIYKLMDKTRSATVRQNLINLAKKDLSQKTGVKEATIKVGNVLEKSWSDTSLGCPRPGMFYAQVITPGYLITFEVKGKKYEYHTDLERIILCREEGK